MQLGNLEVFRNAPPVIVAEIGAAHNGTVEEAAKLIEQAANVGADAVKVQCFLPDTITFNSRNSDFIIKDGPWAGENLYELYEAAHMPRDWFPILFGVAERYGIPIFSSTFSMEDTDFLDSIGCPAYKISSFEITDTPLIKHAASKGKPVILSSGMASSYEISQARLAALAGGCAPHDLGVLHCVSSYPTPIRESRLSVYCPGYYLGISDHSLGSAVAVAATVKGARMVEKHITLSRANQGLDDGFASEPDEFKVLVDDVHGIWHSINESNSEIGAHAPLRRSLYAVKDIKAGWIVTSDNVRSIRPGNGMAPSAINLIIGKRVNCDIVAGTPIIETFFDD